MTWGALFVWPKTFLSGAIDKYTTEKQKKH